MKKEHRKLLDDMEGRLMLHDSILKVVKEIDEDCEEKEYLDEVAFIIRKNILEKYGKLHALGELGLQELAIRMAILMDQWNIKTPEELRQLIEVIKKQKKKW